MPTVDDLLATRTPEVKSLALQARELVRAIMPAAIERVSLGNNNISYSFGPKMSDQVCYVAPFNDSVNIGFMRGAELPDPHRILRGTGKMLRHIKLRKPEDLQQPGLRDLLEWSIPKAEK